MTNFNVSKMVLKKYSNAQNQIYKINFLRLIFYYTSGNTGDVTITCSELTAVYKTF